MSTDAYMINDMSKIITPNRLLGLWKMMVGFRLKYIGATISLGISALAKTGSYFLVRYFVDDFFMEGNRAISLPIIALGFIVLALIQGATSFQSGRLASQTAEGITRRLRNYLFDHIQHLPFSYHNRMDTGELISRSTSDVDALRRFYSSDAIEVGRIVLLFLINFTAILQLNVKLGLASVVIIPIIVITSFLFFKKVSKAYDSYQKQEAILSTTLQENLTGVRVVKAFARQPYEMDKFERDNYEKFVRGKNLLRMHALFWPVSDILCGLQMLGGYLLGALMAINGEITVGTYLAYAGMIVWLIFPMRNLGRIIVNMSTGLVSYGRVTDILKEKREPLDEGISVPPDQIRGEIEFKQVGFAYESDHPVLQDISFKVKPGQVIALLGSTGSGKTTLVNLLPRFFDYTSGEILLDGRPLNQYSRRCLRQAIGIVEQEPFLFSRTIRENITYGIGKEVSQSEVEKAAEIAAIHDVIQSFPQGYQTLVGEKGVTLSGGQKQRLAIARTILKNPRILILDDSTSSVDTETEAEIRQAMQKLMQNRTTFIIAHRIQSLMDADIILVLDKGKIVQRGNHDELLAQEGIYRQIYDIQTRIETELEEELSSVG